MKNKIICIFVFILSSVFVQAQHNFVTNWSFEDTVHCPDNAAQIDYANHWYSPTTMTPDYYNGCSYYMGVPYTDGCSFQYAKDGQAFAGIWCYDTFYFDERDYIQTVLTDTLVKNKIYCAGIWVNLGDCLQYAVDQIGIYFSTLPVGASSSVMLHYIPQIESPYGVILTDTINWVLISGSFQAHGGEKYITIGGFREDSQTNMLFINPAGTQPISYYYIDAVFLYECDSAKIAEAGTNITICRDSSVVLGSTTLTGCKYKWRPADGLNNDTIAQPFASPQVTTTYYLTLTDPFYQITTDSVVVLVQNDCNNATVYMPNIFSPNSDGQNDMFLVRGESIESLHLTVYNRWGEKVFESQNQNEGWDGNFKGKPCSPDVYVYHATIMFKDGTETSRKGNVTLVR